MRHKKKGRKLNRSSSHRKALMKNMAISLIMHEKISSTHEKCKELQRYVEPLITSGKKGGLHSRRRVASKLNHKEAVRKVFAELGPRYSDRPGGYTRVVRIGARPGDSAEMSVIMFCE